MLMCKWIVCIAIPFMFFLVSCGEEEPDICESYCGEMSDCYRLLDEPFSGSECKRKCYDNMERYSSVGCRGRYIDLVECKTDLSCTDANKVSEICAPETEAAVKCYSE